MYFSIAHIYHKANREVDFLANEGINSKIEDVVFDSREVLVMLLQALVNPF